MAYYSERFGLDRIEYEDQDIDDAEWERQEQERKQKFYARQYEARQTQKQKAIHMAKDTNENLINAARKDNKNLFRTLCDEKEPTLTREDAAQSIGANMIKLASMSDKNADKRWARATNPRNIGFKLIAAYITNVAVMRDEMETLVRRYC